MYRNLKKILGKVKRASHGIIQNNFEKNHKITPHASSQLLTQSAGNRDVSYYRIGEGDLKILFVSAIHGNEVGTVKLAHHLTNHLFENRKEFNDYSFFIIPCLNPDGYELALKYPDYFDSGRVGRFNANNVDLNRNFDVPSFKSKSHWCFGKNYSQRTEVFCGPKPFSEPETKALTQLIKREKIKIFYSFHNAGGDIMASKDDLAQNLAEVYSDLTGFRHVDHTSWQELEQSGTAAEWCNLNDVSYIEVEGSTRWGSDWNLQKPAILATLDELGGLAS